MYRKLISTFLIISMAFSLCLCTFTSYGSELADTISSMQEQEAQTQQKISDLEKQTKETQDAISALESQKQDTQNNRGESLHISVLLVIRTKILIRVQS